MATPLEYSVTPEDGLCRYDEASVRTAVKGAGAYVASVAQKYALGRDLVHFEATTRPAAVLVNGSAYRSSLVAASRETQDGSARFGRGLTTTYTESVKRAYYRASLIPSQLQADSFTELFKGAAVALAESGDASAAVAFILEWGNFVVDKAVMGAALHRTLYTQADATDMTVQRAKAMELMGDMSGLLGSQDPSAATSDVISENGKRYRFEVSKTYSIGDMVGGPCDIGGGMNPQVRGVWRASWGRRLASWHGRGIAGSQGEAEAGTAPERVSV